MWRSLWCDIWCDAYYDFMFNVTLIMIWFIMWRPSWCYVKCDAQYDVKFDVTLTMIWCLMWRSSWCDVKCDAHHDVIFNVTLIMMWHLMWRSSWCNRIQSFLKLKVKAMGSKNSLNVGLILTRQIANISSAPICPFKNFFLCVLTSFSCSFFISRKYTYFNNHILTWERYVDPLFQ